MEQVAKGTFEVTITSQENDVPKDNYLGRMLIDKKFHGDLEASSFGQMLTAGTDVKDSAGYVAIEKVTGTLHGKEGTFILQHSGTMHNGTAQLSLTVVPDSGTENLVGLTGSMEIIVADSKHSYMFTYNI